MCSFCRAQSSGAADTSPDSVNSEPGETSETGETYSRVRKRRPSNPEFAKGNVKKRHQRVQQDASTKPTSSESADSDFSPTRLGRTRRWTPTATAASDVQRNQSLASIVLRALGYVPGPQLPMDFGGPQEDYTLVGASATVAHLLWPESAAAGPTPLSLRDQRLRARQAARAGGKQQAVDWHNSPVAGLLPKSKARPPTPKARVKKRKKKQSLGAIQLSGAMVGAQNLTLSWDNPAAKERKQHKKSQRLRGERPSSVRHARKGIYEVVVPMQTSMRPIRNRSRAARLPHSSPPLKLKRKRNKRTANNLRPQRASPKEDGDTYGNKQHQKGKEKRVSPTTGKQTEQLEEQPEEQAHPQHSTEKKKRKKEQKRKTKTKNAKPREEDKEEMASSPATQPGSDPTTTDPDKSKGKKARKTKSKAKRRHVTKKKKGARSKDAKQRVDNSDDSMKEGGNDDDSHAISKTDSHRNHMAKVRRARLRGLPSRSRQSPIESDAVGGENQGKRQQQDGHRDQHTQKKSDHRRRRKQTETETDGRR